MKIISLIVRRPGLDRWTFARHYDERHGPLALRLLPAPFAAYRRNHVVEPLEAPFDCVSEFCFPSPEEARIIFEFLASEAGQPLHEDEERFMDRARNVFYVVEEQAVRGPVDGSFGGADADLVKVWALSEAEPIDRAAAIGCRHNRVSGASREDAPPWACLTELWYRDEADWARDREAWGPPAEGVLAVRVEVSVGVPGRG